MHLVCRVEACQFEVVLHTLTQCGVGLSEDLGHQKEGWAAIEPVITLLHERGTTTRCGRLLHDRYFVTCAGQSAGRRQSTDPRSDNYGRWHYPASLVELLLLY